MKRHLAAAVILLLAAACAPYTLVEPKKLVVQGGFSVEPSQPWNRITPGLGEGPVEVWTAEGQGLDAITFVAGISGGASLFRAKQGEDPYPAFSDQMSPSEIMELVEASIVRAARTSLVETRNLRPARLGDTDGFRFDFSYVRQDDSVDRDGFVVGAVRNKKLYLIMFHGTRLYHFKKQAPQVEKLVESVRFL